MKGYQMTNYPQRSEGEDITHGDFTASPLQDGNYMVEGPGGVATMTKAEWEELINET